MNKQKFLKLFLILIGLLIIVFSGFFVINSLNYLDNLKLSQIKVLFHSKNQNQDQDQTNNDQISDNLDTSNWKTYRNEEFGFELKYPEELLAQELDYKDDRTLFMFCLDQEKKTFRDVCAVDLSIIKLYAKNGRIDVDFGLPYYKEEPIKIGQYDMMKYYGFKSQRLLGVYWRKTDEIVYDFSSDIEEGNKQLLFLILQTFHSF